MRLDKRVEYRLYQRCTDNKKDSLGKDLHDIFIIKSADDDLTRLEEFHE